MQKEGSIAFDVFNYALMIILIFVCVYPFYYILVYSISEPKEALKGIVFLPREPTLINYIQIFKLDNISNAFFISTGRTVIGTMMTIFGSSLFAYLMTKDELYFRKLMYRLSVISMYFSAGLIPWYLTMKFFGLKNTFLLYVVPSMVVVFYVVLIKTFIEQLPKALEESAMMDGAGYFKIFTKVIFPLSFPIIATVAVFSAVAQWNTFFDNFFLASSDHLQTLQLILYSYLTEAQQVVQNSNLDDLNRGTASQISPESVRVTITMIVTVPVLLVYPFLQRYFVKGIMIGSLKG